MTAAEKKALRSEFARLYPNWPSAVQLTLRQMAEQVDFMKRTQAVCELIQEK